MVFIGGFMIFEKELIRKQKIQCVVIFIIFADEHICLFINLINKHAGNRARKSIKSG